MCTGTVRFGTFASALNLTIVQEAEAEQSAVVGLPQYHLHFISIVMYSKNL